MGAAVTLVVPSPGNAPYDQKVSAANPLPVSSTVITRTKTGSAVTAASTTSQQLFAANSSRVRLIVQNHDAAINIFVNLGAPATTAGGNLRIPPGGSIELEGTNESVNAIASSGTPVICAWEF